MAASYEEKKRETSRRHYHRSISRKKDATDGENGRDGLLGRRHHIASHIVLRAALRFLRIFHIVRISAHIKRIAWRQHLHRAHVGMA